MSELSNSSGTEQGTQPAPAPVPTGWLWAVRAVPLAAFVSAAAAVIVMHVREDPTAGLFGVVLFFLLLPYLHILLGLRRGANLRTLAFAGFWGFTLTGLTLLFGLPNLLSPTGSTENWWKVLAITSALLVPNALLVAGAIFLSLKLPAEAGRVGRIVRGVALTGMYGFVMIMVSASMPMLFFYSQMNTNQASAAVSVKQLVICAEAYSEENPGLGFPATGELMGPEGFQCVNEVLADAITDGGFPKSGYYFQYTPGQPDAEGMISTFEILARPIQFDQTGRISFYADESEVIRSTEEDRPATKDDPPLN